MLRYRQIAILFLVLTTSMPEGVTASLSPEWPQWRGPDGQGHASADIRGLPVDWSETNNVSWKTPIPGRGHSSPVIGQGRIWVTTAFETPASPDVVERRKKTDTGGQPLNILAEVALKAVSLDLKTGKILREVDVFRAKDPQWVHQQNSYASPTPALDGDRLYVHYGSLGTACLDATSGKVLWSNQDLQVMHENGPGSSPVLWKNHLIVHFDGSDAQFIAAFDRVSGKIAWKTERTGKMGSHPQLRKSYGTPVIAEFNGQTELLSPAADWLYSYDPATGSERWKIPYEITGFSIVPRPVLGHGMIYFSTSFMKSELLAVKYDGTRPAEIAWRWKRSVPQTPSPIVVDDCLYFVSDSGGLLTCLDAKSGEIHYQERLGGNFAASPTYADGRLYFHDRDGVTTVIQPGKSFKVLARNTLDGSHMASAAVADRALFLRTDRALYKVQQLSLP